jgi:hypothetical protein
MFDDSFANTNSVLSLPSNGSAAYSRTTKSRIFADFHSDFFTSKTFKGGPAFVGSHYSVNSVIHRPTPNTYGLILHRTIVALQMSRLPWTREHRTASLGEISVKK